MSANDYNPIWYCWNVERLIDSLIRGSIGSNADFSLATGILLNFGSTFGLWCLGTWMYVFSCLNLTCWILHSPLARTIKLDMQHSWVTYCRYCCSLCRYREWPGLRQGHLSYDSTKTSAVLPSSCVEIGAVQPCLQPWLRCTSSAACIP